VSGKSHHRDEVHGLTAGEEPTTKKRGAVLGDGSADSDARFNRFSEILVIFKS
jgi:hypothetical protein